MYGLLPDAADTRVSVTIDGKAVTVPAGASVAAALLLAGSVPSRTTPVSHAPRAPYCMMGVCFECLVEIDGIPDRQACMIAAADGMTIRRAPRTLPGATR
jgi:D-hydroxyproline dehydrogenase subunit gamma